MTRLFSISGRHTRRPRSRWASWALILISIALPSEHVVSLWAQQSLQPLPVDDSLQTHSIDEGSPLALSPDGKWVAYALHNNQGAFSRSGNEETDLYVKTGVLLSARSDDIWVSNTYTSERQNLTEGQDTNWDPVWSPDGRYLAFLSTRQRSEQARLWVWDSLMNRLSPVSNRPVRESPLDNGIQWTRDSRGILVTTVPEGLSAEQYAQKVLSPGRVGETSSATAPKSTVTVYTARSANLPVDQTSPMFNLDAQYLRDLVLVDLTTGQARTVLHGRDIGWHSLSPDGKRIACAVPKRFAGPASFELVYDLVTVNLETMQEQTLAADVRLDDAFSWSPDGAALAYGAYDPDQKSYDYFVVSITAAWSHEVAVLPYHPHLDSGLSRVPIWNPHGQYLYFIENGGLRRASVLRDESVVLARIPNHAITRLIVMSGDVLWTLDQAASTVVVAHDVKGKQDGFYRIDLLTGNSTKLLEAGQCYSCSFTPGPHSSSTVSATGQEFVYTAEDVQHPSEVWIMDAGFQKPRRVTHLNSQFDKYQMGGAEVIDWLSDDGEPLRGALLLPAGYEAGKKYPLVVWVYPGATLSDHFDEFGLGEFPGPFDAQLLATRGYAVLFPDARDEVGDRISALEKSILPAVNRVIALGVADPARIGLMGHSQGGYATLALITHTTRFKAAVECSGWGDYAGLYGSMNKDGTSFQYGQTERHLGGTPWQNPERYVLNSPLFYFDRIATPLLILQGSSDGTLSSSLASEMFVGLRRLGKTVEYAEYAGESHSPGDWSYANQLDVAGRILGWFDLYLKKGAQQN